MDSVNPLYVDELAPIRIGLQSLIGVCGNAPHSWGNYFELAGYGRVVNFWSENLRAANRFFKLDDSVKIRTYFDGERKYVLIDDDRIPKDWYYNKLCFTGMWQPSVDVARYMYEYLGDPTFEFERFTDPVSYYAKRGGVYKAGTVSYTLPNTDTKFNTIKIG